MLVCLPYPKRDQERVIALVEWIAELGNVSDHDLILFPDDDVDCSQELLVAQSCFRTAKSSPIDKPTTTVWPISANHTFRRVVDFVDFFKLYPMLYLESDAIPLKPHWLNLLEVEYRSCGKPFMGYLEYGGDPQRRHMNGVAVYGDIYALAPSTMQAPTTDNGQNYCAFDWQGKDEIVPRMHISHLFQFAYKKEAGLLKDETLSWLNRDAAIFHTCKDVRIFDLLRKKLFGKSACVSGSNVSAASTAQEPVSAELIPPQQPPEGSNPSALTTDIFIKTYDKVADWHEFAMRSIKRFCRGFRKTVVVGQQPVEGYQEMQVVKLTADQHTDADFILFTDSDCIFSTDVTPETYMRDGKSIWLHRNWTAALKQEGDAVMRWHRGMEKFFGIEPPHEFMCRHPELVPRWLLIAFRQFCKRRHGVSLEEWILKDKEFADWNMLGMYAWLYHRESFHWINQDEVTPPPMTLKQYWGGHEPIGPHIAEMEAILAGGVAVQHAPPGPIQRNGDASNFAPETKVGRIKRRAGRKLRPRIARTPEQQAAINARMAKARAGRKVAA